MRKNFVVIVKFEILEKDFDTLNSLIQSFFKNEFSKVNGFISAKIHCNETKTLLVNYAMWESKDHFVRFAQEIASKSDISKRIQMFPCSTDFLYEMETLKSSV